MTSDEAYELIKTEKPKLIYISGKTSTGKSTFSTRLVQDFDYQIIELDKIVNDNVIKPLKLPNEGVAFVEIYRERTHKEWVNLFVHSTINLTQKHIQNDDHLIIEGAVANPLTLQEIFQSFPEFVFIYFHPTNLDNYSRNLTTRFLTTTEQYKAGLPKAFWEFIAAEEFKTFCQTKIVTEKIKIGIKEYAHLSQTESTARLDEFKKFFKNIYIVEI